MTETRKQIIELIEPYMDKNLCEGCLIEIEWWEILQLWIYKTYTLWVYNQINSDEYYDSYIILGYYDITAVLKYINKKRKAEIYLVTNDKFTIIVPELQENWYIPNKPLHLYTEQEEKDLLDLLTKLK